MTIPWIAVTLHSYMEPQKENQTFGGPLKFSLFNLVQTVGSVAGDFL